MLSEMPSGKRTLMTSWGYLRGEGGRGASGKPARDGRSDARQCVREVGFGGDRGDRAIAADRAQDVDGNFLW